MSGSSASQDCPNCNGKNTLMTYADWKPHDVVSGECVRCGYYFFTQNGFMSKSELKARRNDFDINGKKIPIYRGKNKMEKW